MILVDTSVWVDHLRRGNTRLIASLGDGEVVCHPFVVGELACGSLANRDEILDHLRALPQADTVRDDEVLQLIEARRLFGKGLGWVDVHLLTSASIAGCRLWTLDKSLHTAAAQLGVAAEPAAR